MDQAVKSALDCRPVAQFFSEGLQAKLNHKIVLPYASIESAPDFLRHPPLIPKKLYEIPQGIFKGQVVLLPFDNHFYVSFIIGNENLSLSWEDLTSRFFTPALADLSELLLASTESVIVFAAAPRNVVPGSQTFVNNLNNVVVRAEMSYDSKVQGMRVTISCVAATFGG